MRKIVSVVLMAFVMATSVFAGDRKIEELINNYEPVESVRIYPEMADEFASLFNDAIAAKDCETTYDAQELANAIKNGTQYVAAIKECKGWTGYLVFDGETYYYFYIEDVIALSIMPTNWSKHLTEMNYYQKVEKLGNLETETGFKLYKTIDWEGNVNYTLEAIN